MKRAGGTAELWVGRSGGQSTVLRSLSRSPLCLLTPHPRGPSVWAYTSSLGGGLVAGDELTLRVEVDADARCFLGTQSSTKIYRNPERRQCSQHLHAILGPRALLVLAPDPVQCFADARYEQRQTFDLAGGASLVLVDWLSAGRLARGERWQFQRYFSRNEVRREGKPIFIDALELGPGSSANKFEAGNFNCIAMVLLLGPFAGGCLERVREIPVQPGATLLCSASPVQGGVVLRFAGPGTAQVGAAIYSHLSFIRDLLADDPWLRKW